MITPVDKLKILKHPNGDFTQWFGENPSLYARFGLAGHNGVDIVRPHGEVMYAIEDGIIVDDKDDPNGYGIHLRLIGFSKDSEDKQREWTYGHCAMNLVSQGQVVKKGEAIALMGNTGFVVSGPTPFWNTNPYAGTHLHLGLRYVKKSNTGWSYPGSDYKFKVLNYSNGYKGSVDPIQELWKCGNLSTSEIWIQKAKVTIALLKIKLGLQKKHG